MAKRNRRPPQGRFEAEIRGLSHEGRGIANLDGKTVFINGALPGEQVQFEYRYASAKFDEGTAIEVLTASKDRVEPKCEHFLVCGGCNLQHLHTQKQIEHKQWVLEEQLKHFAQLTPESWLAPLTGPVWGYRRKARLAVKYVHKKADVLVGFREKNGRFVADIKACQVMDERVGLIIPELRDLIKGLSAYQHIPQIEVAMGDTEVALVFRHLIPLSAADEGALIDFGKTHSLTIYVQPGGVDSVKPLSQGESDSELVYRLDDFDLAMHFHPMDFTQVNAAINRSMLSLAVELLAPNEDDRVLDLFCGLGNFTLPIARHAKSVVGVEGTDLMVERAKANARYNNIHNTQFYCADLMEDITSHIWYEPSYTKCLLDPPRTGAMAIIKQLGHLSLQRLVYVSCNPATLARDAAELVHEQGYRLVKAGVMDMFPHTGHVESIAVFEK